MRLFILILLLLIPLATLASDNPFAGESGAEISIEEPVDTTTSAVRTRGKAPFWYGYIQWQKKINRNLSDLMLGLKDNFSATKLSIILFISLFYSMAHTAGPGHGKVVLSTYFLTSEEEHNSKDAILAGIVVSLTHIGTAFLLSLFFYFVLESLVEATQSSSAAELGTRIGGALIALTQLLLLFSQTKWGQQLGKKLESKLRRFKGKTPSLIWYSILSGIVPCPLAWFVLIFSISFDMYLYGILSVVAMAIGAALTVGGTGALVIRGRKQVFSFFPLEKAKQLSRILRITGAVVLGLLGVTMMLG